MHLPINLAKGYKSKSQIARITTEAWVVSKIHCPNCMAQLMHCSANTKTKDAYCSNQKCNEIFQIKSSKIKISNKILGANYETTFRSIKARKHPSLILLHYSAVQMQVVDLCIIHHSYITKSCLIKRKPLAPTAKRAGWVGCMIDLALIPDMAKMFIIKDGKRKSSLLVCKKWKLGNKVLNSTIETRSWICDILAIIEKQENKFTLTQVYKYQDYLAKLHPKNNNIRAKIRQQLQIIRNLGVIVFEAPGKYKKTKYLL